MKQRATTVEGVRLEPAMLWGYRGDLNGRRIAVRQEGRDWIVWQIRHWVFRRRIGGGRTLREAIKRAKGE